MTGRRVEPARIARSTLVLAAVSAAVAAATGAAAWPSLLLGAAFMLANFHLIRLLVSRLIAAEGSPAVAAGLLTLKVVLVLALLAGLFFRLPIAPMSFAFGASLLLVAAVLDATWLGEPIADDPRGNDDGEATTEH